MKKSKLPFLLLAGLATVLAQTVAGTAGAGQDDVGEPNGLKGDYYVSSAPGTFDFHEYKGTAVDPNIDFDDLEPTLAAMTGQSDYVTARWTGRIEPRFSQTYTFSVIGDNGFRLWVDDQLILDHWVDDWNIEYQSDPITLEAGRTYAFRMEFFEHWGGSNLHLSWSSPSQPKQIVPREAFSLPEGFEYDGPATADVTADGTSVVLDFAPDLRPLPAGAVEHLGVLAGREWPLEAVRLNPADPSVIVLTASVPIPGAGDEVLRVSYDGQGGITTAEGRALGAFNTFAINNSEYLIESPWADEVSPGNALPEYPRPQMTRPRWKNLNGTWQFAAATEGEPPPVGRDLGERVLVPYPVESQLSGIGRHEDRMWYRRTITVPPGWREGPGAGSRVLLHFGAVDWRTAVYVNGQQVGTHEGGYDGFTLEVTDALRPGPRQEVVVGVYDPTDQGGQPIGKQRLDPSGIFYTAVSGIWQTVWMEPVPAAHIERLEITPDPAGESLRLTVHAGGVTDETVVATARDGDRTVGRVTGRAGEELALPVPDPRLWSPDDPFLYDLDVRLVDAVRPDRPVGPVVDRVSSYFGMRSVGLGTVAGKTRMLVNGEPVFHMGPLDQGFWPDGIYTAPTDEALKYDLVETKRLGFNAVRKHVKVEPDRWYYWADRLGLLVWQDMPSMFPPGAPTAEQRQQFETELREMVTEKASHPSIVMWVPFNEGWGQYEGARIADTVQDWDPGRLVNGASGWNDTGNGDIIDHHAYPGPGTPEPSETRAAVNGEYGGLGLLVLGHTWSAGGWGYQTLPDVEALTDRYIELSQRLEELLRCDGLSGAIYTQTTDVETELNGLLTYDRRVVKPDVERIRDINRRLIELSTTPEGQTCA